MGKNICSLVKNMTLEEKAKLCSGLDNWHTVPVERLGIPSIMMTDGPYGVRKESNEVGDGMLINKSYPATCFPTSSALACSWNKDMMYQVGEALGEECLAYDVSILLGPGVNIKRSPLCGRNFEYYSEDPFLAGKLACGFINGVQSKGIGTSLKHFAANNQETDRLTISAEIDERTLREIYLTNFEIAVKNAKPWTVMCAYNRLLGTFCSENKKLLTDILRDEWGFEGMVMSDWGAVNERVDGVAAGLDLEMPAGGKDSENKIIEAVNSGKLSESILDTTVERILTVISRGLQNRQENATFDKQAHHKLARHIAGECMVLLKNDNVLPLKRKGRLAVIGAFAKKPRFEGGGSSHINPTCVTVPFDELCKSAGNAMEITYCDGYPLESGNELVGVEFGKEEAEPDEAMIRDAVSEAAKADVAVVFAGLPDSYESEGYDRKHMRIPKSHQKLIEEVAKAAKHTVVLLMNGSPVEMPWAGEVDGILECYLGGQASGGAIADILFGDVNPSGKLAETFPVKLSDNPSYLNYPGSQNQVEYREGIFVGYRYYEKKQMKPLYPFGYGLSYTTFTYTGIKTDRTEINENETVNVKVTVRNTGSRQGSEILQLYVHEISSRVVRPEKELKGFEKVTLEPGQEKIVNFELGKRAFAYYDESIHNWRIDAGTFEILVGGSSADTPLTTVVMVRPDCSKRAQFTRNSTIGEVLSDPAGKVALRLIAGEMVESVPAYVLQMPLRNIHMQMPDVNDEVIDNLLSMLNA